MQLSESQIFIYVFTGSAAGTGLAYIIIELLLKHWLDRLYYSFKLRTKDIRGTAEEALEVIKTENSSELGVINSNIFRKAQSVYDRFRILKQYKTSEIFWSYVISCIEFNPLFHRIKNPDPKEDVTELIHSFNQLMTEKSKKRDDVLNSIAKLFK